MAIAASLGLNIHLDLGRPLGQARPATRDGVGHGWQAGAAAFRFEIALAKAWAARPPKEAPEPTELQREFIKASEEEVRCVLSGAALPKSGGTSICHGMKTSTAQ